MRLSLQIAHTKGGARGGEEFREQTRVSVEEVIFSKVAKNQ
jgi:hypothetical protein